MPPGVQVELTAHQVQTLARDLRQAALFDRRRLLNALGSVGENVTRERIHAGGPGPEGETWQPRRHPSSKPLLVRSGHLARSITAGWTMGSSVRWGSRLVYARIHQFGGRIRATNAKALRFEAGGEAVFARSVTIPARPYLGWGAEEARQAAPVIANWLAQAFPGADA